MKKKDFAEYPQIKLQQRLKLPTWVDISDAFFHVEENPIHCGGGHYNSYGKYDSYGKYASGGDGGGYTDY